MSAPTRRLSLPPIAAPAAAPPAPPMTAPCVFLVPGRFSQPTAGPSANAPAANMIVVRFIHIAVSLSLGLHMDPPSSLLRPDAGVAETKITG